jgi:hypothetical protein
MRAIVGSMRLLVSDPTSRWSALATHKVRIALMHMIRKTNAAVSEGAEITVFSSQK